MQSIVLVACYAYVIWLGLVYIFHQTKLVTTKIFGGYLTLSLHMLNCLLIKFNQNIGRSQTNRIAKCSCVKLLNDCFQYRSEYLKSFHTICHRKIYMSRYIIKLNLNHLFTSECR